VTQLFAQLYLDEDLDVSIASRVRWMGFQAETARSMGNLGLKDPQQLAFAVQNDWVIVTHNREDFEALAEEYRRTNRVHCGIIVAFRRKPQEIARRLAKLVNTLTASEMRNQLFYV